MEILTKVDSIPLIQVIYTSLLKLCIGLMLWKKFIYLALINTDLVPVAFSSLCGVHSF